MELSHNPQELSVNSDPIVAFELHLTTVDDCHNGYYYKIENQRVVLDREDGWSEEPDMHTQDGQIIIRRASGNCDFVDITGSTHRDIDEGEGYEAIFEKILAGADPEEAVRSVVEPALSRPPLRP